MTRSRCGRFNSPEMKLAVCHPPYANITGVMAAPMRTNRSDDSGASRIGWLAQCDLPNANPATTRAAMATSFSSISALCVLLPLRTPRQLMTVRIRSAPTAITASGMPAPVSSTRYFPNVAATAAIPPVCTTSSSAQPYRNATAGW